MYIEGADTLNNKRLIITFSEVYKNIVIFESYKFKF